MVASGLALPVSAWTQTSSTLRVKVWFTSASGVQQEVVDELARRLPAGISVDGRLLPESPPFSVAPEGMAQVVVGASALRRWVESRDRMPRPWSQVPVLAALIPRATYLEVASSLPAGSSGVWLDQSPERFATLIARAFPRRLRVGVLLGPQRDAWLSGLDLALRAQGLELIASDPIAQERDLYAALTRVLDRCDVLLAQPDPLIFNGQTFQNILIAAYRQRVPMVSYAESHVRAGATAGVFTSPTDVADQVAVALQTLVTTGRLPMASMASRSSVAINVQVARSLGIELPPQAELDAALQRGRP